MTDSVNFIPNKDLKQGKRLGAGGFGIVYRGTWQGKDVAIKKLKMVQLSPALKKDFVNEVVAMARLKHARVIQLHGVCDDPGHYAMIMDFMPNGDLYGLLSNKSRELKWEMRWQLALDVAEGLAYLHRMQVLHRDMKSQNILLDKEMRAKITDFGLAKIRQKTKSIYTNTMKGSLPWMAPELFKRKIKVTKKADIYAYGMVMWEIASRRTPFAEDLQGRDPGILAIWVGQSERPEIPKDCPTKFAEAIKRCWRQDPDKRPPAHAVLKRLQHISPVKALDVKHTVLKSLEKVSIGNVQPTVSGKAEYDTAYALFAKSQYRNALPHFEKAASKGYPLAYMKLTEIYHFRLGKPINTKEADHWKAEVIKHLDWFKKEAKRSNAQALSDLGDWYSWGIGTQKDYKTANTYYKEAANQGHAEAQCSLADHYNHGLGLEKDEKTAFKYYKMAAEQNYANGHRMLAQCYEVGVGIEENALLAIKHYQLAAGLGDVDAQCRLGVLYYTGGGIEKDYKKAFDCFEMAAKQGFAKAQFNLGDCYGLGHGVEKNPKLSAEYVKKAADQGHELGQFLAGCNYVLGEGVKKDLHQAAKYLKMAAAQGNADAKQALEHLGTRYYKGEGVEKDFKIAADLGHAEAQYLIALRYLNGEGVEEDLETAFKYFKMAADQGLGKAQYELGMCYNWAIGVKEDDNMALKYLKMAAEQGNPSAIQALKNGL